MHTLIIGRSITGKSGLAKQIGSHLRLSGKKVFAFNPTGEAGYTRQDAYGCAAAEFETDDINEFLSAVTDELNKNPSGNLYLIVDEAHEFFKRADCETLWLGTRGRHYGITIIAVTQRGAQINPTFRGQCSRVFLFACSRLDAKFMADEYGRKEFETATNLAQLEYYQTDGFTVDKGRL